MTDDAGPTEPERDPGLTEAIEVAVEALEERITAARWLLDDRAMHGLADPERVSRGLGRDELALQVLRAAVR